MAHWWQRLLRRNRMALEKEMRFHLDQHTADLSVQATTRKKPGGRPGSLWAAASR